MCSFSYLIFKKELFFLFLLFFIPFTAFCQSHGQEELKKLHENLTDEKKSLEKVVIKEKNFLSEIDRLNRMLADNVKKIDQYSRDIKKIQQAIGNLESEINTLKNKISVRKKHLSSRLVEIYKHQRARNLSELISSKGYIDLLKRIKYLELLFRYDKKVISDYIEKLNELGLKKQELNQQNILLNDIQKKLHEKSKEIIIKREKKDILLRQVQNKKVIQKKIIKELESAARELLKNIAEEEKRQRELQQEQEKILQRERHKEKDRENALRAKKKVQQFAMLKGALPWPIEGKVILSFGSQRSHGLNVPILRNGIVIKAAAGDEVKAIAKGVVVFSDWFKGYGNLLIVNHGSGYHSLYAHLDDSLLSVGEAVEPMQVIGRVGESGLLNKPGLYFELRYKGKPVNPLKWLNKRQRRS